MTENTVLWPRFQLVGFQRIGAPLEYVSCESKSLEQEVGVGLIYVLLILGEVDVQFRSFRLDREGGNCVGGHAACC